MPRRRATPRLDPRRRRLTRNRPRATRGGPQEQPSVVLDAHGTRKPSDRGVSCLVVASGGDHNRSAIMPFYQFSGLLSLALAGAPSRIRTCAHGSGGQFQIIL